MSTPVVHELRRTLEPVEHDTFTDDLDPARRPVVSPVDRGFSPINGGIGRKRSIGGAS